MTEIVRIDPRSLGKVMAIVYFGLSLVFAVPLAVLELAGGDGGVGFAVTLGMPFLYAGFGGIAGVVLGLAYNAAVTVVGGLQLTFASEE